MTSSTPAATPSGGRGCRWSPTGWCRVSCFRNEPSQSSTVTEKAESPFSVRAFSVIVKSSRTFVSSWAQSVCTSRYWDIMFRLDDSDPSADNINPRALSCGAGHLSVPHNQERKHLKGQKPYQSIKYIFGYFVFQRKKLFTFLHLFKFFAIIRSPLQIVLRYIHKRKWDKHIKAIHIKF